MSTATAAGYVRRMVEMQTRGWGDQENAVYRLAREYRIPFWTLSNLRTGRTKTVDAGLFGRLRAAYLKECERQVAQLQHEIVLEQARGSDDTLDDLAAEAATLAARLQARRAGMK